MKTIKSFKLQVLTYLSFTILLSCSSGFSQNVFKVNEGQRLLIGEKIEYFIDETRNLGIEEITQQVFTPGENKILNFGIIPHNVWLKFSVKSDTEQELYLEIMAPLLAELELYEIKENKSQRLFEGGFLRPFKDRPIATETWLFNLELKGNETKQIYIKGQSEYPFQVPIAISTKEKFVEYSQLHNIFWGFYIGIMIFALIYNFFIYLSVRERTYLFYIIYIIGSSTFYLALKGFSFKFLWPDSPLFNPHTAVIICLTNIVITLFTLDFLKITKEQKGQYYFGFGLMILFGLIAILSLAEANQIAVGLAQMMSLVASIFFIYAGISSLRRGVTTAKYYLLGWSLFLIFVVIFILADNNVFPSNFFTMNCIFIGHMTEVLLLSFALADRINWLKKDNERKQLEIIHQLEENEKIQLKANRELEQKVIERTAEVVEQKNEAEKQRERSDELLLNILPEETAEELKATGKAKAKLFNEVTVLFADFKNFTKYSEKLSPEILVSEINECFSEFDKIMEQCGVEKIKTIGDAYMAAGGLPTPNSTHANDVVKAALEIQKFMSELRLLKEAEGKPAFVSRIGIHTGPVVSGVVGKKKFAYDIWGDTVNIASRLESSGEPGKVNISETTYKQIKDMFSCEYRGKIKAKNKGMIDMYFINGNTK